jgi:hypothetical protein
MTSILLQPFRLHDLTLPNRIALAPMTRGRGGGSPAKPTNGRALRPAQFGWPARHRSHYDLGGGQRLERVAATSSSRRKRKNSEARNEAQIVTVNKIVGPLARR